MADADQYWAHVAGRKENGLFGGDREVGCVSEKSCLLLASMNTEEERWGVWMSAFQRQLCLGGLLLAS